MNFPRIQRTEATSEPFTLNTPVAKSFRELILLLISIGAAGYLYGNGPAALKIPAVIFVVGGTLLALLLFSAIVVKLLISMNNK
jgi:hypothetical protein